MKLIHGDCLIEMKKLSDKSVDMVLCDLPYGTTNNKWDIPISLELMWDELNRVVKPNGVILLHSHHIFTAKLIISSPETFKYKLVWVKSKATNFLNVKIQPLRKHEEICVFYRKSPTYNPQLTLAEPYDKGIRKDQLTDSYNSFKPTRVQSDGFRHPTDVLYFKTAESEGKVEHSTQKPIALLEYLIKTYTNEKDVVLDFAAGSGSTGVACKNLNRDFIGIELDETYFNIATKRIGV